MTKQLKYVYGNILHDKILPTSKKPTAQHANPLNRFVTPCHLCKPLNSKITHHYVLAHNPKASHQAHQSTPIDTVSINTTNQNNFDTDNLSYLSHRQTWTTKSLKWLNSHLCKPVLFLQLGCVLTVFLPSKNLTDFEPMTAFDRVINSSTLTIATTNHETFFDDGHIHGYGFDVARRYAEYLGVRLKVRHFDNQKDAIVAMQLGQVDMMTGQATKANTMAIDCTGNYAPNANFSFATQGELFANIKAYLCASDTQKTNAQIAKFYQKNLLNGYNQIHFDKVMAERLPKYQDYLQSVANAYDHDWRLLTAIAYQESHLNPNATSPTGVQGIMMLTEDTAKDMGVSDRTNPTQSIQGGAKYLAILNQKFAHIPKENRLFFVLAAYNMGPAAVSRIQNSIAEEGGNPNSWSDFYGYLETHKHQNSRYAQCLHYVTNIRAFFEEIITQNPEETKDSKKPPTHA